MIKKKVSRRWHLGRRSEGAGHDPCRRHGYGVLLVGGERVPDDQLPILRGRDQVPLVRAPVDAENLGVVAFKASADLDVQPLNGFDRFRHLPTKNWSSMHSRVSKYWKFNVLLTKKGVFFDWTVACCSSSLVPLYLLVFLFVFFSKRSELIKKKVPKLLPLSEQLIQAWKDVFVGHESDWRSSETDTLDVDIHFWKLSRLSYLVNLTLSIFSPYSLLTCLYKPGRYLELRRWEPRTSVQTHGMARPKFGTPVMTFVVLHGLLRCGVQLVRIKVF